ncbi:MAG: TolC family protein [Acidobacteriia bacterium]|nr:TolC family protein [Terriglobia bacterium]
MSGDLCGSIHKFAVVAGLVAGSLSALAQGLPASIPMNASAPGPAASMPAALTQSQNPLFGSVASGKATPEVLPLSALDAIDRGLKYNLSLLLAEQATTGARGARYRALADVLPTVTGRVAESVQEINLAAYGIPPPAGTGPIIGPFAVFDARVLASGSFFDLHALNLLRARTEDVSAAQLDLQNARDLIVLVVGGTYMQALAGEARIASVEAQLTTAQALYRQALDMKNAGMVPGIDVLRSQVEMQVQQQRLVAARNDFAKQKLTLGRIIGLPAGQEFSLTEKIPVTPAAPLTLEQALERAYRNRPDYHRAQAQVRAAELTRKAAIGEALPTIKFNADYGIMGQRPSENHPTYTTAAALNIPIFQGGKVKGEVMQADALIRQREATLGDLRGQIEFEVRTSFLDLQSAAEQVQVAQSSSKLAEEALEQSRDRFRAGVTNTVEVVQAQEALAATNENYINSTFAYNVAKLTLARSLGVAERAVKDFLGGKH